MLLRMIRHWVIKRRVKKMMTGMMSDWDVMLKEVKARERLPVVVRRISSTQEPGFLPSGRFGGMFEESDEAFRERIKKEHGL